MLKPFDVTCSFQIPSQMLQALSHPFFDELRQPGAGAPLVLPDLFSFTEEGACLDNAMGLFPPPLLHQSHVPLALAPLQR